jgi:hypothetical protein
VTNLVVADPHLAVNQVKAKDVVEERLALGVPARHVEHLREHLLQQAEVRLAVERGVEGQKGP